MQKISLFLLVLLFFQFSLCAQITAESLLNQLQNAEAANNKTLIADSYNKLGFLYWENEKHQSAIDVFEKSIVVNKEIGNENALKVLYTNMGMIFSDMGQPETAVVYFRKSLLISTNQNNKRDMGTNLMNIAIALQTLDRNQESFEHLEEALAVLLELNDKKMLSLCYNYLFEVTKQLGLTEKSVEYFSMYSTFQKNVQDEEVKQHRKEAERKVAEEKQKTKSAIKEQKVTEKKLVVTQDSLKVAEEINFQNQMKLKLQEAQLKSQRLLNIIFISGSIFLAIIALIILYSYRQKRKHNIVLAQRNDEIKHQNELIMDKNKKINQSINYARNIQGALLPDQDFLRQMFPESFIFFSPRDVVSGDFYWFTKVKLNNETLKIIAAVDCTGHGVPGAFMSMLGMSFLEEIVDEKHITEPHLILEQMHQLVRTSLKQATSGNTDGMDMTVCVYNEKSQELKFAGAANPLVFIQNGKMETIRGDFFGIGGTMKESVGKDATFTCTTIKIETPTICYLFSDGFADQFGGDQGRKYFTKNFRKLLFDLHSQSMEEQQAVLDETLKNWHGSMYPRVDDVLVLGFKID